jgi:hypothetical protein
MSGDVPASTLVAQLAYRLGGCWSYAHAAGMPKLADALQGLQGVLSDVHLQLRPSDGRAIMHALAGFEAIFYELESPRLIARDELRGALAAAQAAAQQLAAKLERPELFEGTAYGLRR